LKKVWFAWLLEVDFVGRKRRAESGRKKCLWLERSDSSFYTNAAKKFDSEPKNFVAVTFFPNKTIVELAVVEKQND
jgi:hypothetical protein